MNEKVRERLKGAPRFDTEQAALREAVKRAKADEDANEMVMRQEDGKFLVVGWRDWEIAMVHGKCEPVYGSCYIYDLAEGRNPSEENNRNEIRAITGGRAKPTVKKAMSYNQAREKK